MGGNLGHRDCRERERGDCGNGVRCNRWEWRERRASNGISMRIGGKLWARWGGKSAKLEVGGEPVDDGEGTGQRKGGHGVGMMVDEQVCE